MKTQGDDDHLPTGREASGETNLVSPCSLLPPSVCSDHPPGASLPLAGLSAVQRAPVPGGYAALQHTCCNKGSSTKSNKRNPDESHFAAFCGIRAPIVASFRLQVWGPTHCSLTLFRQRWIGKRCPLTHHYVLFPPLSYNRCKKPQRQGLPWWSSGCVAMKISNATTKTWCRQKN